VLVLEKKIQLNHDAIMLRKSLGEDIESPIDIFALLGSKQDLTIVFHPMRDSISGMSIRDESMKLIAINSRLSKGRQQFTAAHELYHLYFHDGFKTIICARDLNGDRSEAEREADQFASFLLAPYDALLNYMRNTLQNEGRIQTVDDVVRIEQHFGMSRQATLVRLQSEDLLFENDASSMKTNIIRSAQKLGYPAELYLPNPESKQYMTIGSYVKLANDLLVSQRISSGKYEELLLDAFRDDIVYGIDSEGKQYD